MFTAMQRVLIRYGRFLQLFFHSDFGGVKITVEMQGEKDTCSFVFLPHWLRYSLRFAEVSDRFILGMLI